jgi:hypothetical protein
MWSSTRERALEILAKMTATLSTIARETEYDLYLRDDRASSLMPSDRGL